MTLAELAAWHRQHAKALTGAKRDFHAAATKLLSGLVKGKAEHRKGIMAGLQRARAAGKKLGRARIDPAIEEAIRRSLKEGGKGIHKIAAEHGVGTSAVQRVKSELARNSKAAGARG